MGVGRGRDRDLRERQSARGRALRRNGADYLLANAASRKAVEARFAGRATLERSGSRTAGRARLLVGIRRRPFDQVAAGAVMPNERASSSVRACSGTLPRKLFASAESAILA